MTDRERLRISATMDGNAVVASGIGKKIAVSEFELMVLCTLAEIGFMSVMADDEKVGEMAEDDRVKTIDAARESFGKGAKPGDGLTILLNAGAAILRSEKFQKYIACEESDDDHGTNPD